MTLTDRQREILEAAVDIIAKQGIQELTIKKLAARIGVSEPAIYRHFENKLSILIAVLANFGRWSESMLDQISRSEIPPEEKLREVFKQHTKRFMEAPAMTGVVFAEENFRNEDSLVEMMLKIMSSTESYLTAILREGIESGVFRSDLPMKHLALIAMGSLRLLVTKWRFAEYEFDLYREAGSLADSVISMVVA